ncbi:MAG: thioredoxin family protein, partial [Chitinophagaceae bacterium]|nr:thioredoxin family protein [Chitinophagaceae bacterium]
MRRLESINGQLLDNAFTYEAYRNYLAALLAEGKTTGNNQKEELVEYARLNIARMNRIDKTFVPEGVVLDRMQRLADGLMLLTITEGWCGDAAQIVPVIDKIATAAGILHKLVLRDEQPELMDCFLTNGKSRSIPITILLDAHSFEVYGHWGPRPTGAAQLVERLREQLAPKEAITTQLHGWYATDKGRQTALEFSQKLVQLVKATTPT